MENLLQYRLAWARLRAFPRRCGTIGESVMQTNSEVRGCRAMALRVGPAKRFGLLWLRVGCVLACATSVWGLPPLDPLLPPFYSFDCQSPQVLDGTLSCDSVLQFADPTPLEIVPGAALGLGQPGDQIDALSSNSASIIATVPFSVLFSVDRDTVGAVAPDPLLVAQGVPFSVRDQAAKGHAAGDQFISLDTFQLGAAVAGVPVLGSGSNNSQVRNNFDEGGVDFVALPPTSSTTSSTDSEDNVNSTSGTAAAALSVAGISPSVYFSLCRDTRGLCDSPSLATLSPGTPSGASLYFHPNPGQPGIAPTLFASFGSLGLQQDDDISAVVVLDFDANGVFDGVDRVIYSLDPGSPSLALFADASPVGAAADVFVASPDGTRSLLASAAILGLGAPTDNIDALDVLPCADGLGCVLAHGMRVGDVPTVSEWGLVILALSVLSAGVVVMRHSRRIMPVR